MPNTFMKKPAILLAVFSLIVLMCSSCESEQRPDPFDPVDNSVTPRNVGDILQTTISTFDFEGYSRLFHEDFKMILNPDNITRMNIPTDYLNRAEMLRAAENIFSNLSVTNFAGFPSGTIRYIEFERMDYVGPGWTEAALDSRFPGSQVRKIDFRLNFSPVGDYNQNITEYLDIYIDVQVVDGKEVCTIIGLVDSQLDVGTLGWGGLCAQYFAVDDPAPNFTLENFNVYPVQHISCDASAASDSLHGLHELPYRWSFETDVWSDWTADPIADWHGTQLGQRDFIVEVRNRWLKPARGVRIVAVVAGDFDLIPAETRDDLMQNFEFVYFHMNLEHIAEIYSPAFRLMLQPDVVSNFGLPRNYFDYDQEHLIHQHLFSGEAFVNQDDWLVPGINEFVIDIFEQAGAWEPVPETALLFPSTHRAPYNVRITAARTASSDLRIEGLLAIYVSPSGENSTWRIDGIVDHTESKTADAQSSPKRAIEGVSWCVMHALYR